MESMFNVMNRRQNLQNSKLRVRRKRYQERNHDKCVFAIKSPLTEHNALFYTLTTNGDINDIRTDKRPFKLLGTICFELIVSSPGDLISME